MGGLTKKEICSLVHDFLEHLKSRKHLGKTLKRDFLRIVYSEFKEARLSKGIKATSFGSVLFFMKTNGMVKRNYAKDTVTLSSDTSLEKARTDFASINSGQKRKKKNKLEQLASVLHQGPADMSNCIMGLEIGCLPPTKEVQTGHFVHTLVEGENNVQMKIIIKNHAGSHRFLLKAQILSKTTEFSLSEQINQGSEKKIRAGAELSLDVLCSSDFCDVGTCTTEIMFQFSQLRNEEKASVTLIRYIRFKKSNAVVERLRPEKPFVKKKKIQRIQHHSIIPGVKPPNLLTDKLERHLKLQNFTVPNNIQDAVSCNALKKQANSKGPYKNIRHVLESQLDKFNYAQKFNSLLYLEEIQSTIEIQQYDMQSVKMTKKKKLFFLDVPGLAEKRPSVLRGDRIFVSIVGNAEVGEYEGFVHVVERDRIGIGFHSKLFSHHRPSMQFNVRFTVNRLPMKLAHRVVSMSLLEEVLFPSKSSVLYSDIKISNQDFKNKLIANNPEQVKAVNNIVRGKAASMPYIIFGPPGTGKTVTMVEAIHQVVTIYEECHILVCAPSNSACDLITKKLLKHVRPENIFRMHAASRNWNEVPDKVQVVSNYNGEEFYFPSKKDLYDYEIIVCTLVTAGRIASAKFPDDHFTHVFIDESGQATEPECMVAIGGILARGAQVVLAGDPKQLGPVLMSPVANEYGLGISFLERLMENEPLYQKNQSQSYNPLHITKLLHNYRSCKEIIKVPDELFYDNELLAAADEKMRVSFQYLMPAYFPVIFEGVRGEDLRESNSPSYYNPQEISVVTSYVERFLQHGESGDQIGIITPYRKQVQKMRKVLKNPDIKIGSVEEFQGQERKIIIISTVRSDSEHLLFDARHRLGFLANPKRFNVALTRAMSLLVIVGNPYLLSLDYYWNKILEYCMENHSYRGIAYNPSDGRESEMNEIEKLITDLKIKSN